MPPVCITHPFGLNGKWIIQDTEGMIDLTFNPISDNCRNLNIVALKTTYHILYGNYDGVLTTFEGEKLNLHNFSGVMEESMLRL